MGGSAWNKILRIEPGVMKMKSIPVFNVVISLKLPIRSGTTAPPEISVMRTQFTTITLYCSTREAAPSMATCSTSESAIFNRATEFGKCVLLSTS